MKDSQDNYYSAMLNIIASWVCPDDAGKLLFSIISGLFSVLFLASLYREHRLEKLDELR